MQQCTSLVQCNSLPRPIEGLRQISIYPAWITRASSGLVHSAFSCTPAVISFCLPPAGVKGVLHLPATVANADCGGRDYRRNRGWAGQGHVVVLGRRGNEVDRRESQCRSPGHHAGHTGMTPGSCTAILTCRVRKKNPCLLARLLVCTLPPTTQVSKRASKLFSLSPCFSDSSVL